MFNDERINAECGKIYSRGILLAVLITLCYALCRTVTLIIQDSLDTFVTYTEAVILLLGVAILIIGAVRFGTGGDERVAFERHSYYKKAGIAFIIAVFGTYILTIPFTTTEMLGGQPHNHLLILLEVVGYLYLFYSFKTKDINFNYRFIAQDGWDYYSKVLANIGWLFLALFPPFLLAAAWELVLYGSVTGALAILMAYGSSALGLSIEYFFISLVEKTSYNTIGGRRFALGTRITVTVCLAVKFTVSVLQSVYVHLVTGNMQAITNIGQKIALVSQYRLRTELLLTVLVGLAVCGILPQIKKGSLLYRVCGIEMLILAISAIEAILTPIIYRAIPEEALRFLANEITPWINFISFAISLTMWILLIRALTKELGFSRILWAIPAVTVATNALNIFLTSQNMLRIGTYCLYAAEIGCLVLLTVLLWQYHGFVPEDGEVSEEL